MKLFSIYYPYDVPLSSWSGTSDLADHFTMSSDVASRLRRYINLRFTYLLT